MMKKNADYFRFHIKIDKNLREALRQTCNEKSLSAYITHIFVEVFHIIEKKDFKMDSAIFPGEPEQSEDMYIVMNRKMKGQLFQIQEHFRLRSKAAVLRLVLRLYLIKCRQYSREKLHEGLQRSRRIWEKEKIKTGRWEKKQDKAPSSSYVMFTYGEDTSLLSVTVIPKASFS